MQTGRQPDEVTHVRRVRMCDRKVAAPLTTHSRHQTRHPTAQFHLNYAAVCAVVVIWANESNQSELA